MLSKNFKSLRLFIFELQAKTKLILSKISVVYIFFTDYYKNIGHFYFWHPQVHSRSQFLSEILLKIKFITFLLILFFKCNRIYKKKHASFLSLYALSSESKTTINIYYNPLYDRVYNLYRYYYYILYNAIFRN